MKKGAVVCGVEQSAGTHATMKHASCPSLSSDSFMMEYCGEVCTTEEFMRRKKEYHKERRRHYYFMSLKSDEVSQLVALHSICTQALCHCSWVHLHTYTQTPHLWRVLMQGQLSKHDGHNEQPITRANSLIDMPGLM